MAETTPPRYVQAWAKAHGCETGPNWCWEDHDPVPCVISGGNVHVPDRDSDAWLAGIIRAMVDATPTGVIIDHNGCVNHEGVTHYTVEGACGPDLVTAIENAVLGEPT